jgi:hypothetical protein
MKSGGCVGYDPDYERFLQDLDDLKNQVPMYKPREGLTERILTAVHNDRRSRIKNRLREMSTPLAVAAGLLLMWFFFRVPVGAAVSWSVSAPLAVNAVTLEN